MQIFDDKTQKNSTDKPRTKYEFICFWDNKKKKILFSISISWGGI